IDRSGYRPFEGRRRVVIIDQADTMLAPAQSALLKVLEEPPPATVFILVTSRPDMLLPTVHLRCPRLRFQSAEREQIDEDVRDAARDVLVEVAATDDPGAGLTRQRICCRKAAAGKWSATMSPRTCARWRRS